MSRPSSILIVDDEGNFCNTVSKILRKKGYDTSIAENGQRAVDLVKERPFDVILMDVKMSVMNGVEAYKLIKQIQPYTTVIFITAFPLEDLVKDALKEGAYAMLNKPLDMDAVINMIEKSKNGALLVVVDDDPNIRKTMKQAMERIGYSVIVCSNGAEAIALAQVRTYDIFFIDMKLPVLNGLEVYLEIKRVNPKAVVMMMTAYQQELGKLVQEAIEKGAYACLQKPYEMDDVIRFVEEVIARRQL